MHLISLISTSFTLKSVLDHKFLMTNLFKALCRNSTAFELFAYINNIQRSIIEVFYTTNLENPIDFHYIINQSSELTKIAVEYSEYIREVTKKDEITHGMFETFVKEKKRLDELKESFEQWKNVNLKFIDDVEARLTKRRKMLGVKWEERDMVNRLQRVTRKRAGIKRQKALQEKKQMIKFKF